MRKLGTFIGMTFGIGNNFYKAFLLTNTSTINNEIMKSDKIISLYGDFFSDLSQDFFKQSVLY